MSRFQGMEDLSQAVEDAMEEEVKKEEFWTRLDQFRSTRPTNSTPAPADAKQEEDLAASLLDDINLRLLFLSVDWAHRVGDEAKCKASSGALIRVFRSTVGAKVLRESPEVIPFLLAGLSHHLAEVKRVAVNALVALGTGGGEGQRDRCRGFLDPPLLPALVALLGDSHVGVALEAGNALVSLCEMGATESNAGFTVVMSALSKYLGDITGGLTAREAATPRLRFADACARVVALSDGAFMAARDTGTLSIVTDVAEDANDMLLRLNGLELLEQVASTQAGGRHLLTHGHVKAGAIGDDPPDPLLGPSALRVLAAVHAKTSSMGAEAWAEVDPDLATAFLGACLVHMEAMDEAGKLAALVAASTIAQCAEASLRAMLEEPRGEKCLLDSWFTLSRHKTGIVPDREAFPGLSERIHISSTAKWAYFLVELKAAAVHAVAKVLGPPPSPSDVPSPDSLSARQKSLSGLHKSLFERLGACNQKAARALMMDLMRQPVPELKHAAYDLTRCVVWQPGGWGLQAMFSQPGFREFLERRDLETSKVGKEWKFSVVESVMRCPNRGLLGQDTLDSLTSILKQGPFWIPARKREFEMAS